MYGDIPVTPAQVLDPVREWMGWCPQAHSVNQIFPVIQGDTVVSSPRGRLRPAGTLRWFRRFRNRIIAQAAFYTAFIPVFLVPSMKFGDYLPFFIAGIAVALMVFVLRAGALWRLYENTRTIGNATGTVTETITVPVLIIAFIAIAFVVEFIALLGVIPGLDFLMVPAFASGFSILPWPVLLLVTAWEKKTGCRLYLDGRTMSLTADAVRGV